MSARFGMFEVMAWGGIGGAVGGAISTCIFHTPALHKTAMKIVAFGALQGAVAQAAGFGVAYQFKDNKWQIGSQLVSAAVITAAAATLLRATNKEALANFALSSLVGLLVFM